MPPPEGEVARRSRVGGGVVLVDRTLPQSAFADSPLSEGAKNYRLSQKRQAALGSFMVQLSRLVSGLEGHMDAQTAQELLVLLGEDDGEVGLTAPQVFQLLLGLLGHGVREGRDGQGQQHLVGVEPEVLENLELKTKRVRQRQTEAKAHQRNVRTGKVRRAPVTKKD